MITWLSPLISTVENGAADHSVVPRLTFWSRVKMNEDVGQARTRVLVPVVNTRSKGCGGEESGTIRPATELVRLPAQFVIAT